jgi:formylmethanofuran dehydrogenase subunit E
LLVEVRDQTAGRRDGRDYSHIRYKATLAIGAEAAFGPAVAACLARVQEVHGATGPWAVAGYRIGERALKELGLTRQSHDLEVIHRSPAEVQYSCIADGVQAATGASPGKLNLRLEPASREDLRTVIRDRKSGRVLTFTLRPEFARSVADLPIDRLEAEGRRVATLPDEAIFRVVESK